MERGTYPTLWQWNGKRYLPHPVAVKWKEVLTPPCGKWKGVLNPSYVSGMERGTYPTLWQWNGKRYLPMLCQLWQMERGTYPTLWQWNGKVYLTHLMSAKWKEVLTPPCGSGMERCT